MLEIISEREFLLIDSLKGEYELNNTGHLFIYFFSQISFVIS